jgi:DNA-directed RNA polymerase subunit alpha
MKIILPKIKMVKSEDNYGLFEISPLQSGYGVTLGNSLRRILLSSLAGAAVKNVQIEGVDHEFSTINGIKEDVIEIILAFKKLNVRYDSDDDVELKIKAKGPGKITAADIEAPSDVEIVNPDLHIATLQKSGEFFATITVGKGVGYVPAEEREDDEDRTIGQIAIDANYAPIEHVKYQTSLTRVGGTTDYDKLELHITTDGTVDPKDALSQASKILVKHFDLISNLEETQEEEMDVEVKESSSFKKEEASNNKKTGNKKKKSTKVTRETAIGETGLSSRTINILESNNVRTVGGLARYNQETLAEMEGLGPKSIKEIENKLNKWGIK